MVNEALVRDGYALASTYPPDVRYSGLFASLQAQARDGQRGLWGPPATHHLPLSSAILQASYVFRYNALVYPPAGEVGEVTGRRDCP